MSTRFRLRSEVLQTPPTPTSIERSSSSSSSLSRSVNWTYSFDAPSQPVSDGYRFWVAIPLDGIQFLCEVDERKSFLVGRHVYVYKSTEERRLWVRPNFSNNLAYLACLIGCFVRLEVGDHTDGVSRIRSKQQAKFLFSFYQAFSPRASVKSKWFNHTVVLTRLIAWKNLLYILCGPIGRECWIHWLLLCRRVKLP